MTDGWLPPPGGQWGGRRGARRAVPWCRGASGGRSGGDCIRVPARLRVTLRQTNLKARKCRPRALLSGGLAPPPAGDRLRIPSAPGYVTSAIKCVGRGDLGRGGSRVRVPPPVAGPRGEPGGGRARGSPAVPFPGAARASGTEEPCPAAGSGGRRNLWRGRQVGAAGRAAGSRGQAGRA
ncbi:cuticle collagen 19-like [Aquila chrysaetos chrysaetos]|uniref:cuticle collagen 19-like n=1 Tax=Aquila chrysaetos chrysaetos TaxID=223781 RepID=UPI00117676CD|nr:cuticle collagen 19-like [Aquila chrysaetos chrysaetos]